MRPSTIVRLRLSAVPTGRRRLAAALSLGLLLSPIATIGVRADDASQLQALRQQEAAQRAQLGQLGAQQQAALAELGRLRAALNASQADLAEALAQARALQDQVSAMQAAETDLAHHHDDRSRAFDGEIRDLYKSGSGQMLVFLFSASSFNDLLERFMYVNTVARNTQRTAQRLASDRDALAAARVKIQKLRDELEPLLKSLASKADAVAASYRGQAAVESTIEQQQREQLAALRGTQQQERSLEAALAAAQAAAAAAAKKGSGQAYGSVCPPAPAGKISFCGHGWGHGVGLAQFGALGMAQAGRGWQQIVAAFYTGTSLTAIPETPSPPVVRVFLHGAGSTVTPRAGVATIQDSSGAVKGTVAQDVAVKFTANPDGSVTATWAGGTAQGKPLRLVPASGIFQVSGSGSRYRGEAWVDASSGLKVVNHVDIESYLQGIAEVPSSWPADAIKAQMTAARTYALYHLGGGVYDFDDTTAAQVYGGLDRETSAQNAAVAGTRGQAITYRGTFIDAVFSSSDGGHTQCASAEWGSTDNPCSPAYLQGVIDNFDVSPLHTWYTPPHTIQELQNYLGTTYNSALCGALVSFDLSDRDASNRLNHVRMVGTRGTCAVGPGTFITAINAGSPSDFVVYGEMFGVTPGNHAWPYW